MKRTFVCNGALLLNKLIKPSGLLVLLMFLVLSVSIGYSVLSTSLNITGLITKVRLKSDIRITDLTLSNISNEGLSNYNEYNKENISM